jgi:hypothetical protein
MIDLRELDILLPPEQAGSHSLCVPASAKLTIIIGFTMK